MNTKQFKHFLDDAGIVFDIGDTIINVNAIRHKALFQLVPNIPNSKKGILITRILNEFDNFARKERYNNHLFGIPVPMFEYSICKYMELNEVEAQVFASHYRQRVRSLLKPDPKISSMLQSLRSTGAKIGVLTNGTIEGMADSVRLTGIADYCDAIGISEAISAVKPEPEAFQWMSTALDTAPQKLVMVGNDLKADILGSLAAGWKAIWINGSQNIAPANVPCLKPSFFHKVPMLVMKLLEA